MLILSLIKGDVHWEIRHSLLVRNGCLKQAFDLALKENDREQKDSDTE